MSKGKGGMKFLPHILISKPNSFARLFLKAFSLSAISLIAIFTSLTFFLIPLTNADAQITLVWDHPDSGPPPTGHIIYYGTEQGIYTAWDSVGNVKEYTFSGLDLD